MNGDWTAATAGIVGIRAGLFEVAQRMQRVLGKPVDVLVEGAEKSAFTGATARSDGLFRQAHGGTLFLDEIGELPLAVQPKLLRALQEKSVRRIGGGDEQWIDVPILSATNVELCKAAERHFRTDLYYHIPEFPIQLPPL